MIVKYRPHHILIAAFVAIAGFIALPAAASVDCAAIAKADFSQLPGAPTQILSSKAVEATASTAAYCEVRGYVAPQVKFAVRLPARGWNGKLLFQGCGGLCGGVFIERADDALRRGYATATTDMGHVSTPVDGKWAHNNRELEMDFGWRATHVATVAAKAIVDRHYGRPRELTYYRGCSTGGRQGLVAAQRFPEDFDGIIAGAPVIQYGRGVGLQLLWSVLSTLDASGRSILAPNDVRLLAARVMAACDELDGLKDGVITSPRRCAFKPETLLCADGNTHGCLSAAQIAAVQRIYAGPRKKNGEKLFAGGLEFGSEPNWIGPYVGENGEPGSYFSFIGDLFRYVVLAEDPGPAWDPRSFDFDRDAPLLDAMEPFYNGANPDLRRFEAHGGKLIQYHGWRDQSVVPVVSLDYHALVTRTMGGPAATGAFYRLFMIPGMNHCVGGPGAHEIDYLSALENWRERGMAPEKLVGRGTREDGSRFTRPAFVHPLEARYVRKRNADDEASFVPAPSAR